VGEVWRLGTRGSALARTQSGHVAQALTALTGVPVELVVIRTRGDAITDRPLPQVGGKGLFTKEIEDALLDGAVDLAVHSYKDLPSSSPPGLVVAGLPPREDPRDALVGATLAALPEGAVVGTGSARRRLQLLAARPDLDVVDVRGNVDTRVRKVRDGGLHAVVLAAAGLARLGRAHDVDEALPVETMVPAVAQGVLAVQAREDDDVLRAALARLTDPDTAVCVALERAFLATLGGGCSVPAACHAWIDGDAVAYAAFLGREDGAAVVERGRALRSEVEPVGADLGLRLGRALAAHPPPR